jgi:hypothetical protein
MASHDSQRGRGRQRSPPPWACVPHERVEGVERRPCGGRRSLIREHITARPGGARRDGCRHLPPARTCATDSPSSLPWRSWTIRAADKSRCRDGCDERVACGIVRPTDPHIGDRHSVIGTRANVVSTQIMAQYLVETVERLARECPDIHGAHDHHAFKGMREATGGEDQAPPRKPCACRAGKGGDQITVSVIQPTGAREPLYEQ